ncbi:MAG TPA: PilZ domain-containing protein [Vicinamibacteria bacterium]|nr:PilZ domain-containing protein [Vicinamibacteria bacterium]
MEREIDLIRELSELTVAKIHRGGTLPRTSERRFSDLKTFYEELMMRRELQRVPSSERYDVDELRGLLPRRFALRVPLRMSLFFCHDETYAPAQSANLSHGGLFVGSDVTVDPGAELTLYMPNLGRGFEHLFETPADVVWSQTSRALPWRGMGCRFRDLQEMAEVQLDDCITGFLRDRLSRSSPAVVRPSWIDARHLTV